MSTIQISFTARGIGSAGYVEVGFNDNALTHALRLIAKTGPSITGYFSQIPLDIPTDPDEAQAATYAQAFNRDYRNVGGVQNLTATVNGDQVTITANIGTFTTFFQTGNYAINEGINNSPQITPITFSVSRSNSVGDCDTIQYTATASGGTAPYTLRDGTSILVPSWDGTAHNFNLNRAKISDINVTDANGTKVSESVNVPRKLKIGEFKEKYTQFEGYSDITIDSVNPVTGTTPVEYAMSNADGSNKSDFQTSNSFPGVFPGTYILYVRDVYECEVSKTIVVTEFTGGVEDKVSEYFLIPPHNSIAFCENNESVNLKYGFEQEWGAEVIGTQFKSSFPYHNITMIGESEAKRVVTFKMVQENLGFKEKVDCVLFEINGKTGIYFDGGNSYEVDTETVIDASPYNGFRPSWAVAGRAVTLDAIGSHLIDGIGFDTDRQKYYFTIDNPYSGVDSDSKIQVRYNIHDYNVFEAYANMAFLSEKSYFLFEYGYSENEIVGFEKSIIQKPLVLTSKHLKLKWSDSRNRGDFVFQTGIVGYMNIPGNFLETSITGSELAQGDDGSYNLVQKSRSGWKLQLDLLPPEIWKKLDIVTGLGSFYINDTLLKRANPTKVSELGETNLREFEAEFEYGVDNLAIKDDELVLNISNGVEGGGGSGKPGPPLAHDGLIRLIDESGNFISINGRLIALA
jgi:hypothetical protein